MQGLGKIIGLFICLFIPGLIFGQYKKGKILSGKTNSALAYVNIIISGKNIGTVSDESGNFILDNDKIHDEDSLLFSMIGYEPKFLPIAHFKEDTFRNVYLNPKCYDLEEVVMTSHKFKTKKVRLGTPVQPNIIKSGFAENNLGSEFGVKIKAKGRVRLQNLNLNVATCTFDTVKYRLNIYQSIDQTEYKNILTEPIYITFSKDKIDNHVSFDLSEYSLIVEGNVIVALELYKDLGEGKLLFHTNFLAGSTQFRKTHDSNWAEASGVIGIYLQGYALR